MAKDLRMETARIEVELYKLTVQISEVIAESCGVPGTMSNARREAQRLMEQALQALKVARTGTSS